MNNEKMVKIYYIYAKNKMGIRSININLTLFIIPPTHLEDLFRQQNTKKKKSSKFETNSNSDDRSRTIQHSKSRMEFSNALYQLENYLVLNLVILV